ncbi:hypothetical protein FKV24_006850 [Lysobacter maris]|uniref:Uncharacterized protein n=1 Tax=Marilutibacter maris TaxID=1605891 RepID=A0A508AVU3_9GAMM|nr:hypothetical protein [Lysobacter maris]KAB8192936.1 hypothetical protein FKV24_006850 [Lysobacter maris]
METLSSSTTFLAKRVFPVAWFGFLAVFLGIVLWSGVWTEQPVVVLQPLLMAVFGYFLFRKLLWDIADEVRDGGTCLLVRKGDVEERIDLGNVMNVDSSQFASPRRITLRLRVPGSLGQDVAFIPKHSFQFNPFARNAVAEELILRIDKLRNSH